MPVAVGVDMGGTKIAAGLVDERGRVLARERVPTEHDDAEALTTTLAHLVKELATKDVVGVGVGAAGVVEFETGRYLFGPNTGLRDVPLVQVLSSAIGLRVRVDNDANAAAWAEHRFGSGRGTRQFLLVTVGTGIGGGLVANGRPYRGANGGAAEIGHMLVDPNGPLCGCGRRGCWEQFASGKALERTARDELAGEPGSLLFERADGDPSRVDGVMVTDAARAGDPFALALVDRVAAWLGVGLGSLVNILEPERISVAGGIADDWDLFAKTTIATMVERMEAPEFRPPPVVARAELGEDAGIVGAACLVLADER